MKKYLLAISLVTLLVTMNLSSVIGVSVGGIVVWNKKEAKQIHQIFEEMENGKREKQVSHTCLKSVNRLETRPSLCALHVNIGNQ